MATNTYKMSNDLNVPGNSQISDKETLKILDEHKKYFETGKTKNIDFRIKQLVKLKQVIEANEESIIGALHQDLHKSRYEAFVFEIIPVYNSIRLSIKNDPYSNLLECLVVQLPPVVVSHTQYTTTKWKKSLVTYELISNDETLMLIFNLRGKFRD